MASVLFRGNTLAGMSLGHSVPTPYSVPPTSFRKLVISGESQNLLGTESGITCFFVIYTSHTNQISPYTRVVQQNSVSHCPKN